MLMNDGIGYPYISRRLASPPPLGALLRSRELQSPLPPCCGLGLSRSCPRSGRRRCSLLQNRRHARRSLCARVGEESTPSYALFDAWSRFVLASGTGFCLLARTGRFLHFCEYHLLYIFFFLEGKAPVRLGSPGSSLPATTASTKVPVQHNPTPAFVQPWRCDSMSASLHGHVFRSTLVAVASKPKPNCQPASHPQESRQQHRRRQQHEQIRRRQQSGGGGRGWGILPRRGGRR